MTSPKEPIDVVIITVREDEYAAVARHIPSRRSYPRKHRTYELGRVENRHGLSYSVALLRTAEQGPTVAQDTARDAIEDLDPSWIFLVGICGAVPEKEFTLGDVIVATRLHDFIVGAQIEGVPPEYSDQGGPMKKEVQDLLAMVPALDFGGWNTAAKLRTPRPKVQMLTNQFYGPRSWRNSTRSSLRHHFGSRKRRVRPLLTTRSVASSGQLVKDTQVLAQWRKAARDVMAVEMELSGVLVAARRRTKEYPVIAIRGISDIVGYRRDSAWTAYACATAGSFAAALLQHLPPHFLAPKQRRAMRPSRRGDASQILPKIGSYDHPRWTAHLIDLSLQFKRHRWFFRDRPSLRREGQYLETIAKWAQRYQRPDLFLLVLPALREYFDLTGLWADRVRLSNVGLTYARSLRDYESLVATHVAQSWILSAQDDSESALRHINDALDISRAKELSGWECEALAMKAVVMRRLGNRRVALDLCEEASKAASRLDAEDRTHAEAWVQYEFALNARDGHQWGKAKNHLLAARGVLRVDARDNPTFNVEFAWLVHAALGSIDEHDGHLVEAESIFLQSLAFFLEAGSKSHVATTLLRLARLQERQGRLLKAKDYALEAAEIGRSIGSPKILRASREIGVGLHD